MTNPQAPERIAQPITKHFGSLESADSAAGTESSSTAKESRVPRGITVEDWNYIVLALRFIAEMTRNPESRKRAIELLGKLGKGE